MDPPATPAKPQGGPSPKWRIARWLAPAVLFLFIVGLWGGLYGIGGLTAVGLWYAILLLLPLAGAVVFVGSVAVMAFKRRSSAPAWVGIALALFAMWPALWLFEIATIAFPADIESTKPAATVRLPVDGPLVVGWGGDHLDVNYHRYAPDQRWAYDFIREPILRGKVPLEKQGCWDIPVVAPAKGKIVVAHDGERDQKPGEPITPPEPRGNFVAIELAQTGTYLIIAHFRRGTIKVKVDQHVEEGELLGHCGNSGASDAPHIHMHHQRQNPAVYPHGFAEGLPLFLRDHGGPPMPEGGLEKRADHYYVPPGKTCTHGAGG